MVNLLEVCRTCMNANTTLLSIFKDENNFAHKLNISVSLNVAENDGLPEKICENCHEFVNNVYYFRLQCEKNDSILKQECYQLKQEYKNTDNLETKHTPESTDYVKNIDKPSDTDKYKCETCNKISKTYRGHCIHMVKHNGKQGKFCTICNKALVSGLAAHIKIVHGGYRPFKCPDCDKAYGKSSGLDEHRRSKHLGLKPYECYICYKQFGTKRQLETHGRIHTGHKPHLCSECGKEFTQLSSLLAHQHTHSKVRAYVCMEPLCGAKCSTASALAQHKHRHHTIKVKGGSGLCSECGKDFSSKAALAQHMVKHTGESPHKCIVCSQYFGREDHLKVHMRTHTNERPHKCDVCSKSFTQSSVLATHMTLHTGKNHECQICSKLYSRPSQLKRHLITHTTKRPYKCEHCTKTFCQKSQMTEHTKIHTGNKQFKCDICMKRFTKSTALRAHVATHAATKPYNCDICEVGFTQRNRLEKHISLNNCTAPLTRPTPEITEETVVNNGDVLVQIDSCIQEETLHMQSDLNACVNILDGLRTVELITHENGIFVKKSLPVLIVPNTFIATNN